MKIKINTLLGEYMAEFTDVGLGLGSILTIKKLGYKSFYFFKVKMWSEVLDNYYTKSLKDLKKLGPQHMINLAEKEILTFENNLKEWKAWEEENGKNDLFSG